MGQVEIENFLLKSKIPLNRGQIAIGLNEPPGKISHAIRRLLKSRDIECIEVDRNQAAKLLNSTSPLRRMRFYYVGKGKKKILEKKFQDQKTYNYIGNN